MQSHILGNPPKTKKWWGRRLQYTVVKSLRALVRLDETPYRVAMGCACGIFSSALPVFGQTFIGIVLARLLKASVIASIPWSWISNPVTTLPMWYGGYRLGIWVLSEKSQALTYTQIQELVTDIDTLNWTQGFLLMSGTLWEALKPLWLGATILGIAMAIPGFFIAYYLVVWRLRRQSSRRKKTDAIDFQK